MKANEVQEKIWLGKYTQNLMLSDPNSNTYVEYIRKDTFIEKACEFLKSYRQNTPDGFGYIAGIVNDKTIEDFKKYMEREEV